MQAKQWNLFAVRVEKIAVVVERTRHKSPVALSKTKASTTDNDAARCLLVSTGQHKRYNGNI